MKRKFKVWDRVKISESIRDNSTRLKPGSIGIIICVEGNTIPYYVSNMNGSEKWWYCEDELELVEENKTYEQGLEDAWKMANRLTTMTYDLHNEIFGVDDATNGVRDILRNFTAAEVIEKYRRWEDSHLSVGDVVKVNVTKTSIYSGVVTHISDNRESLSILFDDGSVGSVNVKMYEIRKTGQHIDISELLNNIGKES